MDGTSLSGRDRGYLTIRPPVRHSLARIEVDCAQASLDTWVSRAPRAEDGALFASRGPLRALARLRDPRTRYTART